MNTLILQALLPLVLAQYQAIPPITGQISEDIAFSGNGQFLVACYFSAYQLNIYENTGSGFGLLIQLPTTFQPYTVAVNYDGSRVYALFDQIAIYERVNGIFTNVHSIDDGELYITSQVSRQEEMLVLSTGSGKIVIYDKNHAVVQSISSSSGSLKAASASDDFTLLAGGGYANEVKIYKNVAGTFVYQQTLAIGFVPYHIEISRETLIIAGYSSLLLIYSNPGSDYALSQNISLAASAVDEFIVSDDFSKITLGASANLKEYTKASGVYAETYSESMGAGISKVLTDSTRHYVVLLGSYADIYVLYTCPSSCGSCSFPNNCSSCLG